MRSRHAAAPSAIDALWHRAYRLAFQLQRLYWRIFRPTLAGAYVAVWHGGRLLVIENSYRERLSLPAGGLHRGEAPIDTALRELREEVGISADRASLRFVAEIVSHVGLVEDHAHFFELLCDEPPDFEIDRREVVWADFLHPQEALDAGVVDVLRQYLSRERLPDSELAPSSMPAGDD